MQVTSPNLVGAALLCLAGMFTTSSRASGTMSSVFKHSMATIFLQWGPAQYCHIQPRQLLLLRLVLLPNRGVRVSTFRQTHQAAKTVQVVLTELELRHQQSHRALHHQRLPQRQLLLPPVQFCRIVLLNMQMDVRLYLPGRLELILLSNVVNNLQIFPTRTHCLVM